MKNDHAVFLVGLVQSLCMGLSMLGVLWYQYNTLYRPVLHPTIPPCPTCPPDPDCTVPQACVQTDCPEGYFDMGGDLMKEKPGEAERQHPFYLHSENLFSKEECEWIWTNVPKVYRGAMSEHTRDDHSPDPYRHSKTRVADVWSVNRKDPKFRWIYERVLHFANVQNNAYWQYPIPNTVDSENMENLLMAGYNGSVAGHYNWHSDIGVHGFTAKRVLACVVILSHDSEYDGGRFMLTRHTAHGPEEIFLPKAQGSVVMMPAYTIHRVEPVVGGYRRSLVVQINQR